LRQEFHVSGWIRREIHGPLSRAQYSPFATNNNYHFEIKGLIFSAPWAARGRCKWREMDGLAPVAENPVLLG
jgi:hypothetical protein